MNEINNLINQPYESLSGKMRRFAPIFLRIGLSLVFLWFGAQQIINTNMWTSLIPSWLTSLSGISAGVWVHFNGAFEIVFGFCLLAGYFTRITALLLALHLLDITFIVGYTSIGIRDFGLSIGVISIFLYGIDSWCFDKFLAKK
jgi:uncharacterized membrane protein YphA (DoxX/SURF4 family)